MSAATQRVLERCDALGFAASGIAPAKASAYAEHLRRWLDEGRHATMDYLAMDHDLRIDPRRLLRDAKSFIMVADRYSPRGDTDPPSQEPLPQGRIARYARGRDYHALIKRRLHTLCDALRTEHPGNAFRAFVDTVPVLERELAVLAGLGWQAKNTLLIHPELGSYLLLGGVATSLALEPAPRPASDHCGTCTRCLDACPTRAITPYSVDASRCIAYLTIERHEPIAPEFHTPIGDWIFGCDVCQEVCPHNSPRESPGPAIHPDYAPRRRGFDLLSVLGWNESQRRHSFTTSAMKRAPLAIMKRNAILALTNAMQRRGTREWAPRLADLAWDAKEPALVRHAARHALHTLGYADSAPPA